MGLQGYRSFCKVYTDIVFFRCEERAATPGGSAAVVSAGVRLFLFRCKYVCAKMCSWLCYQLICQYKKKNLQDPFYLLTTPFFLFTLFKTPACSSRDALHGSPSRRRTHARVPVRPSVASSPYLKPRVHDLPQWMTFRRGTLRARHGYFF